jgi:hypothetical protein
MQAKDFNGDLDPKIMTLVNVGQRRAREGVANVELDIFFENAGRRDLSGIFAPASKMLNGRSTQYVRRICEDNGLPAISGVYVWRANLCN